MYLVGAGPGDPGLLTRRGAELLSRADVVLHDRLVSPAVLRLVPPGAVLIDVGKDSGSLGGAGLERGDHQEEISRLLVEHGRRSEVVVRLKGGDPFLFGRGGEEVDALIRAGISWEVVPGVTSAFGVPAGVGIPVTQRGVASSVTVVTGRVGDPGTGAPDWDALARAGGTLVVLMGMTTRAAIADALVRGGRAPETPVAVIQNGTTSSQRTTRTTLAGLAEVELGPPAVIVVGPVVALGPVAALGPEAGATTPRRPLEGRTVVVTRHGARARQLVDALEREGALALELPLTRQVDPADGGAALRSAAAAARQYDWVVLTSVNAVERFMGALHDARDLASTRVAAVGPATAEALRGAGVRADLVPAAHNGRALVNAFPMPDSTARRVLFPGADLADDTVPEGLSAKGWDVERVEAYRTVPLPPPDHETLERVAGADAIVLTAASAVHALDALRHPGADAIVLPPLVVCIGASTASAARQVGMRGVHEARRATSEAIVAELLAHLGVDPGEVS